MIKYPRNGYSIPHERVFKMDLENLVCEGEPFTALTVVVFMIVNNVASNRKFKIQLSTNM